MKKLLLLLWVCLAVKVSAQPGPSPMDALKHPPYYHLHFNYEMLSAVDPYYYSIISTGADSATLFLDFYNRPTHRKNWWFTYFEHDFFNDYPEYQTLRDKKKVFKDLNCSKIINSRGDTVFIYILTYQGCDSVEYYNPCFAFAGARSGIRYSTVINWAPSLSGGVEPIATIADYDVDKGTYYFNWWDKGDSLNYYIQQLYDLSYLSSIKDSLCKNRIRLTDYQRRLIGVTDDVFWASRLASYPNDHTTFHNMAFNKIMAKIYALGYGFAKDYDEDKFIDQFGIRRDALLTHKISGEAISPQQLRTYLENPTLPRPPEVEKMLKVFE